MHLILIIATFFISSVVHADQRYDWKHKRMNGSKALSYLKERHRNYFGGRSQAKIDRTTRLKWTETQDPIATVVTCSDSRVLPGKIFDAAISDVFSIEVAGNISCFSSIASIEYGVLHTHTPLVVMLGHEGCGAVGAALKGPQGYAGETGAIRQLLQHIDKPVADTKHKHHITTVPIKGSAGFKQFWLSAVKENVYHQVEQLLMASPAVLETYLKGHVRIVPAIYMLDGQIKWLSEQPVHTYAERITQIAEENHSGMNDHPETNSHEAKHPVKDDHAKAHATKDHADTHKQDHGSNHGH